MALRFDDEPVFGVAIRRPVAPGKVTVSADLEARLAAVLAECEEVAVAPRHIHKVRRLIDSAPMRELLGLAPVVSDARLAVAQDRLVDPDSGELYDRFERG